MNPKMFAFQSHMNTQIGSIQVHDGDHLVVTERHDELWDVVMNDLKLPYSITADWVNQLAGQRLIGVSA